MTRCLRAARSRPGPLAPKYSPHQTSYGLTYRSLATTTPSKDDPGLESVWQHLHSGLATAFWDSPDRQGLPLAVITHRGTQRSLASGMISTSSSSHTTSNRTRASRSPGNLASLPRYHGNALFLTSLSITCYVRRFLMPKSYFTMFM